MKLEIVTGASIFEATKNAFKSIDKKDVDTDYFVVVPDRFTLQAEDILFDTLNLTSSFNINIQSLTGFSEKVLESSQKKLEPISQLQAVILMKEIMEEEKDGLVYYKKSSPMFCHELVKNIMQIKSSMIKPDELIYEGNREILRRKFHDIKILYEKYQQKTAGKIDPTDLIETCSDLIRTTNFLENAVVVFVGFDSFTSANYYLIKAALSRANKIVVGVAQPITQKNAYIYESDIMDKLKMLAKEENVLLNVISPACSLNKNQRMIAENLFSQNTEVVPSDFLHISTSMTKKEEVEYIASLIKYKVHKGERFKDFSIGCSSLEEYGGEIQEVFTKFDIPYYLDLSTDLSGSLLVNLINKIFDLKLKNFKNADLLYLASNPLLDIENREEVLAYINEKNIYGGKNFYIHLKDAFGKILPILESFEKAKTLKDYVQIVRQIISLTETNYLSYIQNLEEKGLLKEKSLEAQVSISLEKILTTLGEEEKEISLDFFIQLFKLGISLSVVSALPAFCDAVFVGDMTSSYFGESKNMIVLGASRGKLPLVMADDGLVSDKDLNSVSKHFKIEPTVKMINRRNRFKLFGNLLLGRDNLFVSYLSADSEGKQTDKAMFVESLMKMFGQTKVLNTSDITYFGLNQNFERFLFSLGGNAMFAKLRLFEYLKDRDVPSEFVSSLQEELKCDFEKFDLERNRLNLECKDVFFPTKTFSVSQLEKFFDCPFKHFVSYGLKLKEKASAKLEVNELGSFYHSILENFVKNHIQNLKDVSDEEIKNFVESNFKKYIDIQKIEFAPDREFILKTLKKDAIKLCRRTVFEAKNSNFKPIMLEMGIEKKFDFEGQKLKLRGKVDRIDKCENGFRTIDYKSGRINKNLFTEVYYGKKLQLFLYSSVVKEKLGLNPKGLYYFSAKPDYENTNSYILEGVTLKGGAKDVDTRFKDEGFQKSDIINAKRIKSGISLCEIDEKGYQRVEEYALNLAKYAVKKICEGNIAPLPEEHSCEYCKFRSLCLYNQNLGVRKFYGKKKEDFLKEAEDE